ncbi:hypothetical protein DFH09DRAFT_1302315 [Mycena vulgaris]|nr:hypothetical protein DFH09DRAFT_1302315 [Mycena vulgaris]
MDTHLRQGEPVTFGVITVVGTIEFSLSAWLTSQFNKHGNEKTLSERERVRFTLFVSTWTATCSGLFLVLSIRSTTGSILTSLPSLVYLASTWLIWTVMAAAITQMLGGGLNCKTEDSESFVYCNQLNALEGFAWAEWLLLTFAVLVVILPRVAAKRRSYGYNPIPTES